MFSTLCREGNARKRLRQSGEALTRRFNTLSVAVMAWLAPLASSAMDNTTLQVSGKISATSCALSLLGRETVDLGPTVANEFVPGEDKLLSPTVAFMTVDCHGAPTKFRLRASDTSGTLASTPGAAHYGLGMNGDKPIGYFKLGIAADIMTDHGFVLKSTDDGAGQAWATPVHDHVLFDHDNETYAFAASATASEPASLRAIAVPLSIQAVLAKDPVVNDEVTLAGQVTLEVLY